MTDIDNINHVGMVVRDLKATVARFEAMGFQLTPFSAHSGAWKPGEQVQRFGSGNRCVMFANNYLEILASEKGHSKRRGWLSTLGGIKVHISFASTLKQHRRWILACVVSAFRHPE